MVDEYLRVPGGGGRVFALGDCAANEATPLPPLASVAEQQGQYLADCFNEHCTPSSSCSFDQWLCLENHAFVATTYYLLLACHYLLQWLMPW